MQKEHSNYISPVLTVQAIEMTGVLLLSGSTPEGSGSDFDPVVIE